MDGRYDGLAALAFGTLRLAASGATTTVLAAELLGTRPLVADALKREARVGRPKRPFE